jgi:hypothetical protein
MTLIDFPKPKEAWTKPKTLEDWPWDKDLGKPYGNINGDGMAFTPNFGVPHEEVNDLARYKEHGDRHENFGMIAALWSIYLGKEVKPHQVAWCMVLMKTARESNGTHSIDNAIDAAGYAALAGELAGGNDNGC